MATESVQPLIALLLSALRQPEKRKQIIYEFQQKVWDAPEDLVMSVEWETLGDLAYDLDFYVPDPKARAEDASFYGDERIVEVIKSALKKLAAYQD